MAVVSWYNTAIPGLEGQITPICTSRMPNGSKQTTIEPLETTLPAPFKPKRNAVTQLSP